MKYLVFVQCEPVVIEAEEGGEVAALAEAMHLAGPSFCDLDIRDDAEAFIVPADSASRFTIGWNLTDVLEGRSGNAEAT